MSEQNHYIYEFGPFRLDKQRYLLLREGEIVPLKPKAFDTLLALVERCGQVLEKDELMRRVWPDTVVEEGKVAMSEKHFNLLALLSTIVFDIWWTRPQIVCQINTFTGRTLSRYNQKLDQMHILVIDNYDSFTYNLVQYLGELGEEIEVRRNDEVTVEEVEADCCPDKIVISPGPGTPDVAGVSMAMIDHFAGRLPMLGVCLGHQAMAQAFGARVVRAPELVHGKSSEICHDGKTIFEDVEYRFRAGRYHSLMVERETLPDCLEISATTPEGIIMGLRHRKFKIEGVQFHPESILTSEGKKLLSNFLKL